MPPFIVDPKTYVLASLVLLQVWQVRLVFRGDLATKRVLDEKNAELDAVKAANAELSKQNGYLLHELGPLVGNVLTALKDSVGARSGGAS